MKIRITGAKLDTYWYANRIGETFEVIPDVVVERCGDYRVSVGKPLDVVGYCVDKEDCEVIAEDSANITVLPDESLGGVEREYREVKRKARVGETVKYVWPGEEPHYDVVTRVDGEGGVRIRRKYIDSDGDEVIGYAKEAYVVLEPTDIIRIDGKRFRMVDRKAAVGERVIVAVSEDIRMPVGAVGTCGESGRYADGSISADMDNGRNVFIDCAYEEYRVLEPVAGELSAQPPLDQAAATIGALQAQIQALELRVAALEPIKTAAKFNDAPRAKSAQDIRDAVVERAKADVKALLAIGRDDHRYLSGESPFHGNWYGVDFAINRERRSVTALVFEINGFTYERVSANPDAVGRAKCAPTDVFNAHIGRAIALRRALGLEVPAEYMSVPNPEEPRVGDVVETYLNDGDLHMTFKIVGMRGNKLYDTLREYTADLGYSSWDPEYGDRIIDDSREEVAE